MKLLSLRRLAEAAVIIPLALLGASACDDNNNGTPPRDTLTISATTVNAGDPVTLTWTSSPNVNVCVATGTDTTNWTGLVAKSGSVTFNAPAAGTYTYTLDCYSVGKVAAATQMLTVQGGTVTEVTPAGQSLVGIDPVNNTVWMPTYALDEGGNLQFVVANQSDVTPAAVAGAHTALKPRASGTGAKISMPQCDTPIAVAYDTNITSFLVECANSVSQQVFVQIVKTAPVATLAQGANVQTITATGVTWNTWGGILFNPNTNQAVVAGSYTIGILDVPKDGTPTFESDSVIQVPGTDSLSLNFATQLLLVCTDGTNFTIDTSVRPLVEVPFDGPSGTTDGNAFDSTTNIAVVSPEFQNFVEVLNFTGLFDAAGGTQPTSVTPVVVNGFGTTGPVGEGPGGQATMNVSTHQAFIADEFGQNFWLVQLPSAAVTGTIDNNGQPGSGTTAGASSAYALAAGVIPMATINNTPTQLGIRGDPAALGIDQVHNIGYLLADTSTSFHLWAGNANTPLFLIAIDLSNPPVGGCTTTLTPDVQNPAVCSATPWAPRMAMLQLN